MLDKRLKVKLDERLARFKDLEAKLSDPAVIGGDPKYPDYMREHGSLSKTMTRYQEYLNLVQQLEDNRAIAEDESQDAELREMAEEEIPELEDRVEPLVTEFVDMLVGGGEDDDRNVMLEIRAGTGGDEAALFAGDLLRMYCNYAEECGWKVEDVSAHPAEVGGFKEVIVGIQGDNVFKRLRYEGGGHRVQRVPETENQGRVHTSAATVAVLPEAEEYDIEIRNEDLKIEVCRSQGPGGQSVNTTDSAVRITHMPTGIMVHMQDEKSQHKNKAKALRVLRSRVYEQKRQEEEEARAKERRGQTGSGDRSERVRTYNFPQNRCTDHRLGRNFPLEEVIEGRMGKLLDALIDYGKQQDLANA